MTTSIRSEATKSVVVVNGLDVLAINQDGTVEVLTPAAAPTGNQVITADQVLGVDQTWQDMTASRTLGTAYTNDTGKPIAVSFYTSTTVGAGRGAALIVDGVIIADSVVGGTTISKKVCVTAIIPNSSTYSVEASDIGAWMELR